jgi:hypothetical protein
MSRRAGPLWRKSWSPALALVALATRGWAGVSVGGAYCHTIGSFDAGTVRLLLHNEGKQEVRIRQVRLNGRDLEMLPNEGAVWWRLTPTPLAPDAYGVLSLRLSEGATAREIVVAAETDAGETVGPVTCSRDRTPACDILAIRFGPGFDPCFVYVRNRSDAPVTVTGAQVNESEAGPPEQLRKFAPVPAHGVTCLPVPLGRRLAAGDGVTVRVALSSGEAPFAYLRAFRSVPIQAWQSADSRPEMSFDPWVFFLTPPTPGAAPTAAREASPFAAYVLAEDAATADYRAGFLGAHAAEIAKRATACIPADPTRRTFLLITQYCRELAYLCYGQLPDLLAVSPYQMYNLPGTPPDSDEYYFRMASEAAAPAPFAAVLEALQSASSSATPVRPRLERWITPLEYDLNATYAMGAGAGGYFVFTREGGQGYDKDDALRRAIARTNARLQFLKPLLSVAAPCALAETAEPNVACRTLLVGDRALLLLLMNRDIPQPGSIWATPVAKPHAKFVVHVRLPQWLELGQATEAGEPPVPVAVRPEGEKGLAVEIDRLETQRTILLHPKSTSAAEVIQGLEDAATRRPLR